MEDLSSLSDKALIEMYSKGENSCATILFKRHKEAIDKASKNGVRLRGMDSDDRLSTAYIVFMESFDKYTGENGASFKTYIERCIKNALISEYRKERALKRRRGFTAVSLDTDEGEQAVDNRTHNYWVSHKTPSYELDREKQQFFSFAE